MTNYLTKPTRWAANISTTAKRKGAGIVQSALLRPLDSLSHSLNRLESTYELIDKANFLLYAIGTPNLQIKKKPRPESPPSLLKKRRRIRLPDGTVVVREYRARNPGSESEDTDTQSDTDTTRSEDESECENDGEGGGVWGGGKGGVIAPTERSERSISGSSISISIPDMDDYFDDEDWVKLDLLGVSGITRQTRRRLRQDQVEDGERRGRDDDDGREGKPGSRDIRGLDGSFGPSRPSRPSGERGYGWSRGLRELTGELEGLTREDGEGEEVRARGRLVEGFKGKGGSGYRETTWWERDMASVMYVPEVPEEREGSESVYYSA